MIRLALALYLVVGMGLGLQAEAADLPLSPRIKPAKILKAVVPRKKDSATKRKVLTFVSTPVKPKPQIAAPSNPPETAEEEAPSEVAVVVPAPAKQPKELELSWFLDALVANADGPKGEDSASMEGNLIVMEPGYVTSPYMVIELSGHILKTPATTVRVDVTVGNVQRSVNWTSDEVKSGRFSISLKAPMSSGELPGYFPVTALALVSREGKQGVAMVSLEKIRVRLGEVTQVATK